MTTLRLPGQKIGYHYTIQNGFDFVALIHGDGQYAPEVLPELLKPLRDDQADAVFGSRMLWRGAALKGGMPLYKFADNKVLTWFQNGLRRTNFSEFHSGIGFTRSQPLRNCRLFTFSSLRRLLEQHGFQISLYRGIPAPYPMALGQNVFSRCLLVINEALIRLAPGLFSYQIFVMAKPNPSLEILLEPAVGESSLRARSIERCPRDP